MESEEVDLKYKSAYASHREPLAATAVHQWIKWRQGIQVWGLYAKNEVYTRGSVIKCESGRSMCVMSALTIAEEPSHSASSSSCTEWDSVHLELHGTIQQALRNSLSGSESGKSMS